MLTAFRFQKTNRNKNKLLHSNRQDWTNCEKDSFPILLYRKIAAAVPFIVMLIALISLPGEAFASEDSALELNKKYHAKLVKCIDGDTAHFEINGKVYKTRFLYIDTPESNVKVEPFGNEATDFSCGMLQNGKEIILETDGPEVYGFN